MRGMQRGLAWALLTAVLLGLMAPRVEAQGGALLPDLDPVAPSTVRVFVPTDGSGRFFLTFKFAYDNLGVGPLIVRGGRADVGSPMLASQVVRIADGSSDVLPGAGLLTYMPDPGYQRWGYGIQGYELRSSDDVVVGTGPALGLCLIDSVNTPVVVLPGEPARAVYKSCGSGLPDLLNLDFGVSVGWRNEHGANFAGQMIDITSLPAGEYVLVHRVDPAGVLSEVSDANNASSVRIRLTVSATSRSVTVLATCPDTATC